MKLPYFIVIAGFTCGLFAVCIPHLSALRIWLGFSTFLSLVYIVTAVSLSLRDGITITSCSLIFDGFFLLELFFNELITGIKAPPRDYSIPGTDTGKVFTTIGASASLVFAFNTGMLPEIQVRFGNHS